MDFKNNLVLNSFLFFLKVSKVGLLLSLTRTDDCSIPSIPRISPLDLGYESFTTNSVFKTQLLLQSEGIAFPLTERKTNREHKKEIIFFLFHIIYKSNQFI